MTSSLLALFSLVTSPVITFVCISDTAVSNTSKSSNDDVVIYWLAFSQSSSLDRRAVLEEVKAFAKSIP